MVGVPVNRVPQVMSQVAKLLNVEGYPVVATDPATQAVTLAAGGVTAYLPLAGLVDLEAEKQRMIKELANIDQQMDRIHNLLGNPGFVKKAPESVVQREQAKLAELTEQKAQIGERLADLEG